HGKVLIRYPEPEKYVDRSVPLEPRPKSRFSQIPLPLPSEWTFQSRGMDGVRRLYGITRLGGRLESKPPVITVGVPLSTAYAAANQSLVRNLIFLGTAAGLALLAA